jgi:sterol desaturase/sphingolipid hydroxylase (fatty acid hydroxylase superfamily)
MRILTHIAGFAGTFLLWTLAIYWIHRLSHIHSRRNPLWRVHVAHHQINYLGSLDPIDPLPKYLKYLFWFGSWKTTLDVVMVLTLPLVAIACFVPQYGILLLILHYFYEVFLSEGTLDHNPRIKGPVTKVFAWGHYHLLHHKNLKVNYGLLITLWDVVFGTAKAAPEDFLQRRPGGQGRAAGGTGSTADLASASSQVS